MAGLPVVIRLLDPPLHEFLPKKNEDIKRISQKLGVSFNELKTRIDDMRESNPMLGHRGCRLGITFPEIYQAQAKAIAEALCDILQKRKIKLFPKIMIPLVMEIGEFRIIRNLIEGAFENVRKERKIKISYKIGTMIELPRAAIMASEIAKEAEFFSFGTNDLTQTTLGISRDDAGRFLPLYLEKKIFKDDPFVSIDEKGVGEMIKIGKERGRSSRKDLEIGICGEHGGDPSSVEFCNKIGLNYVSCSPFRVPVARLAAGQAVLKEKSN
jgi:pyruvate,orthophosphate dikinase